MTHGVRLLVQKNKSDVRTNGSFFESLLPPKNDLILNSSTEKNKCNVQVFQVSLTMIDPTIYAATVRRTRPRHWLSLIMSRLHFGPAANIKFISTTFKNDNQHLDPT